MTWFEEIFEPGQRVPVRVWSKRLAPQTRRQLIQIASAPYVTEHVAAMPDAHVSSGVAVGTVFATEHSVVPRALGGDLGCGMSALHVGPLRARDPRRLERVLTAWRGAIPTGSALHRRPLEVPHTLRAAPLSTRQLERERERLLGRHLGTLGGGNHFIELDRDAHGDAWLLVHSGSRGLGGAIAQHHAAAASSTTALDVRTDGAAYVLDLQWALQFARENRRVLLERAAQLLAEVLGVEPPPLGDAIDVHHNYVAQERWCGRDLWIHRKGAIAAPAGHTVLIPGSMGTMSYLATGLGHAASFGSCAHGAGRVLSRSEARARVRVEALRRAMHGVVYPEQLGHALVEEAPSAYRDLEQVMAEQQDLVQPLHRLTPLLVLKG